MNVLNFNGGLVKQTLYLRFGWLHSMETYGYNFNPHLNPSCTMLSKWNLTSDITLSHSIIGVSKCNKSMWRVIYNLVDIDFIHNDARGLLCQEIQIMNNKKSDYVMWYDKINSIVLILGFVKHFGVTVEWVNYVSNTNIDLHFFTNFISILLGVNNSEDDVLVKTGSYYSMA